MDKRTPKNQTKEKNDGAQLKQTISELKSQNRKLRKEVKLLKKQTNQLRKIVNKADLQNYFESDEVFEEREIVIHTEPEPALAEEVCVECKEDAIEEIILPILGGSTKHIKKCTNCGYKKTTTK